MADAPAKLRCPYCHHEMVHIHFGWFCLARRADMLPQDRMCASTVGDLARRPVP